jgi:hypothetical protein
MAQNELAPNRAGGPNCKLLRTRVSVCLPSERVSTSKDLFYSHELLAYTALVWCADVRFENFLFLS